DHRQGFHTEAGILAFFNGAHLQHERLSKVVPLSDLFNLRMTDLRLKNRCTTLVYHPDLIFGTVVVMDQIVPGLLTDGHNHIGLPGCPTKFETVYAPVNRAVQLRESLKYEIMDGYHTRDTHPAQAGR